LGAEDEKTEIRCQRSDVRRARQEAEDRGQRTDVRGQKSGKDGGPRYKLYPLFQEVTMDSVAELLDQKLHKWQPQTSEEVRRWVAEIINLADQDTLGLLRSRSVEQSVLDLIDEPATR